MAIGVASSSKVASLVAVEVTYRRCRRPRTDVVVLMSKLMVRLHQGISLGRAVVKGELRRTRRRRLRRRWWWKNAYEQRRPSDGYAPSERAFRNGEISPGAKTKGGDVGRARWRQRYWSRSMRMRREHGRCGHGDVVRVGSTIGKGDLDGRDGLRGR